jgi:MoaA/NifB/PqqE/SkfB family radical SAM enzyme
MNFPKTISFTITNNCNLRCKMCGQWSEQGYIENSKETLRNRMQLSDWKRLADEVSRNNISSLLIRGGEPFLFPGIIELLEYINRKGIFISIDTNGSMLDRYAADLVRIGGIHITISVDGPAEIHDEVRGMKGCFGKIKEGVARLIEAEKSTGRCISKSICFTISPYSLKGLGSMPDVARALSIGTLVVVPFNYISSELGLRYESELMENFGRRAFSWEGFHHDSSGIDFGEFLAERKKYLDRLGSIKEYPYKVLSENEYRTWFQDPSLWVGSMECMNIERLIDIQPDGSANFCVDNPDYSLGNVREAAIEELWNSVEAENFRKYRRRNPLAVCYRCVSKHMSENRE